MPIQNYSQDYVVELLKRLYQQSNTPLPQAEFDTLERLVNEERATQEKQNAWVRTQDGKIGVESLDLPIINIYSNVLEKDTASIFVDVPSAYNTLIVTGSGGDDTEIIWCQFNDDTGVSQYSWQYLAISQTSVGPASDGNHSAAIVGRYAAFVAWIIGYSSSVWKKTIMSYMYNTSVNDASLASGQWKSTSPITRMEIFATDNTFVKGSANLLEGTYLTIWALK